MHTENSAAVTPNNFNRSDLEALVMVFKSLKLWKYVSMKGFKMILGSKISFTEARSVQENMEWYGVYSDQSGELNTLGCMEA